MATATLQNLAGELEQLQAQMAALTERLAALENGNAGAKDAPAVAVAAPVAAPVVAALAPVAITEEELLAVSAAIGAFLGVRAHIRYIRLLSSTAWAQQGRVSIQASHRLQG